MILQSLVSYYDRLSTQPDTLPSYGWSWEKISYCIVLNQDGSIHHVEDLRIPPENAKKKTKPLPRSLMVPMLPEGKTSGIKANPLWDNSAYVLGLSEKPKDLDKKYEEFWSIFNSFEFQVNNLCEFITSDALTAKQKLALCSAINEIFADKIKSPLTPESIEAASDPLANAIANQYPPGSCKLEVFLNDLKGRMGSKYPLKKYNCPTFFDFKHKTKSMVAMANFRSFWSRKKQNDLISEEALDENFVFRLIDDGNKFVHECQEFTEQWESYLDNYRSKLTEGQCLINGSKTQIADLHIRIKDVDKAQSSGAYIVSFNKDSFESYGLKKGKNASVGTDAAFKYVTALNHLLRKSDSNKQRLKIGDAVTVFWAEAADSADAEVAESFMSEAISPTDAQETASLASLLQQLSQGVPLQTLRPDLNPDTKFYILGISPNAARLSVRFWYATILNELAWRIAQHYHDLHIEPQQGNGLPEIWRLTYATAPVYAENGKQKTDADRISPQLAGNLARAIFTGQAYLQSLLSQLLIRMRLDGVISFTRISLCKAVINRQIRLNKLTNTKELPMSLDVEEKNVAYRMGRLFAVLESIQKQALGKDINATIRDRYWGAASATPALVFPMLVRNAMNHLAKIRKDDLSKKHLASFFDWQIRDIENGMPTSWPRNLNLQDQGRFAIGYYHQRYTPKIKDKTGKEIENLIAVHDDEDETLNQTTED
jgi:CRISPR-associated protein Csd1